MADEIAINVVENVEQVLINVNEIEEVEEILIQVNEVMGQNGLSAYEIAVANGFVGTEQEWLASLGGGVRIVGEVPIGLKNNINSIFNSAYDFVPESLEVYVNGLLQKLPDDYNTSGTTTIIFTYSPASFENITINYLKQT